jgi:hypothetical protein
VLVQRGRFKEKGVERPRSPDSEDPVVSGFDKFNPTNKLLPDGLDHDDIQSYWKIFSFISKDLR